MAEISAVDLTEWRCGLRRFSNGSPWCHGLPKRVRDRTVSLGRICRLTVAFGCPPWHGHLARGFVSSRRTWARCPCHLRHRQSADVPAAPPVRARRRLASGSPIVRGRSDTPKLALVWSSCSHERERVEALPLAHARGYSEDEEEGGELLSKWFDQMPPALAPGMFTWRAAG